MVTPTTLTIVCWLFLTRKLQTRNKAPPRQPATSCTVCSSLKKLITVYITMKQTVPAHCSTSLNLILSLVYLNVVYLACMEDEIHVDVAVVNPDATVAFSHGVVCNVRMVLGHVLFNQDNLQRVQPRVYANIRHVPSSSSVRCASNSSHPALRRNLS